MFTAGFLRKSSDVLKVIWLTSKLEFSDIQALRKEQEICLVNLARGTERRFRDSPNRFWKKVNFSALSTTPQ